MVIRKEHLLLLEAMLKEMQDRVNADKNGAISEKIKEAITLTAKNYELLKASVELREAVEKQDFTTAIIQRNKIRAMVGEMKQKE